MIKKNFFILLFIIFSNPTISNHTCESLCPNSLTSSICANDKKIYWSLCHARCKNPAAYTLFQCSSQTSYSQCLYSCSLLGRTHHHPQITSINVSVTPPVSSKINYCQKNCDITTPVKYFCGNNGKLFKSQCHANCSGTQIHPRFYCPANLISCQNSCNLPQNQSYFQGPIIPSPPNFNPHPVHPYSNYQPVNVLPPYPPVPVIVPRPCDNNGLFCASNGQVFRGNCSNHFNSSVRVLFNCRKNGIRGIHSCGNVCLRFYRYPCLTNCVNSETSLSCYSNGIIMTNSCLASCMGARKVFSCSGRKRDCAFQCRNVLGGFQSQFILGASRP